jgi:Uncharacterized phage-associated protein
MNELIMQVIFYILKELDIPSIDKIKLIKLVYLADKYHLLNYGRTITDDKYFAMPYGPVADNVYKILETSANGKNPYFYKDKIKVKIKENAKCKFDMLSETDKTAINTILDKFAKYETWDIVALTHKYPEWVKHKNEVEKNRKRIPLKISDLVSIVKEDGFNISHKKLTVLYNMLSN